MLKYTTSMVTFEEIPDKVTLSVAISNCQGHCIGCHSPELRENIGTPLTEEEAFRLIDENDGVNCFLFLGEGNNLMELVVLALRIKEQYPNLSLAVYSGRTQVEDSYFDIFDYVKVGPYIESWGPLNKTTTNQKLYYHKKDITSMFWKNYN